MENIWQKAAEIASKIKNNSLDFDKEHTSWLSEAVYKAQLNMSNAIIDLGAWKEGDLFIKEVNSKINTLKKQAIESANTDSIKRILMFANITVDQLDDLLDIWSFDFSWDFDIDNSVDREMLINEIINTDLNKSNVIQRWIKTLLALDTRSSTMKDKIKEATWI